MVNDIIPEPTDNLAFYPGQINCNTSMIGNPMFIGNTDCNYNFNNDGNQSNDNALIESEYNDMINNYGIIIDYYVNNYDKDGSADNITGTDLTKKYNYPVQLKMYVKYNPGAVSLAKFGYISADELEAIILIKTFTETMSGLKAYSEYGQPCAPKAGDIIKLTNFGKTRPIGMDGKMFICTERLDEDPEINVLGGHYIWRMKFKRFQYDYEGVEDSPDGTKNVIAEARNDQTSDDSIFGRLLNGDNFATENGVDSATTIEELSSQKIYPYDIEEESETLFPFLSGVNKDNPYGY